MHLLCNLAESLNRKIRVRALEILRNMSFNMENRATFLSSNDYQRVMYNVLDKKMAGDEQLLVTLSIWKLVANNAKGKNIIKNSPIMSKLRALKEVVDRHQSDNRIRSTSKLNNDDGASSGEETLEDLAVALKHTLTALNV